MRTTRAVEFGYKCDACKDTQPGVALPDGWKTFADVEASDFDHEEMAQVDLCGSCVEQLPMCMHTMKASAECP